MVIRIKDLQHMLGVINMAEVWGTGIKAAEVSAEADMDGGNDISVEKSYTEVQEATDEAIGIILISLSVIRNSPYRLEIQTNTDSFKYEFRNIYLSGEGIAVVDKRSGEENVRFTIVPYITLAIGAVSGIGEGISGRMSVETENQNRAIYVTEYSPTGEVSYESNCPMNHEPEAIERISKFLVYAHRACLKGEMINE